MQGRMNAAQVVWLVIGSALLAVGVLALLFGSTDFGTGAAIGGETFIVWLANGWDAVIWIALGALGIVAASHGAAARSFALVAGAFFAVVAVWGFIDGNDVFGVMAVDRTDNISHAAIAGVSLVAALLPAPSAAAEQEPRAPSRGAGSGHPFGA